MITNHTVNSNGNQGSNWIWRGTRMRIYRRDGHRCVWCGRKVRAGLGGNATLDHVVSRDRGGSNAPSNLITACRTCNSERARK